MGGQNSKTDVLKEVLNNVSINVFNRNSSSATGYIDQSNRAEIIGNTGGNISGIEQVNSSIINVSAVSDAVSKGDLQSDLTAAITESISQEAPAIGYSANQTNVHSIVKSVIDSKITNESIQNISATVLQSNEIKILANNGTDISAYKQVNEAKLIIELISTTNSEIIAELKTSGTLVGDLTQTTQSFMDFGFALGMIFIGLSVLFMVGGAQVATVATNPFFLLALIGLVIYFDRNSSEEKSSEEEKEEKTNTSTFFGGCQCNNY